ncbi:unnamed protein product [Brassica oleracea]
MVDAERRLLANALLDKSNQRFVLLSDSCIPLFNFTTIYDYLTGTNLSYIGSFDDPRTPGRGRYNPKMYPPINITHWRKGSQWFETTRELALHIIEDTVYYKIFDQYCKPPCYMDEHYIPTFVHMLHGEMSANRSLTWVDWSRAGPHPARFIWPDVTDEFLNRIRFTDKCPYYGSEIPEVDPKTLKIPEEPQKYQKIPKNLSKIRPENPKHTRILPEYRIIFSKNLKFYLKPTIIPKNPNPKL